MATKDFGGREYYKFAGMGVEFVGVAGFFLYCGHLADQRWKSEPWGLIICGGFGLLCGIYLLAKQGYKMMNELDAPKPADNDEQDNPR